MPYSIAYSMSWKSMDEETTFTLYIEDETSFTSDPVDTNLIGLVPADANPVRNLVIDNDENKYTPVRGRSIEILLASSENVNFSTFSVGEDDRFPVRVVAGSSEQLIFKGFLVLENIQSSFLPHPNIVRLVATDNLKTLSDVALVNDSGENPRGVFSLIQFCAWCLKRTGLTLPINVATNLLHESNALSDPNPSLFSNIYLDAKFAEKEINESEDCLTVLQKIIGGLKGFLEQHNGIWWIIMVDEFRHGSTTFYSYSADGAFINSTTTAINRTKDIASGNAIQMRDAAQIVGLYRRKKSVQLFYRYNTPAEIMCNIDFQRGDFISDLPDETIEDETFSVKSYEHDCWTYFRNIPNDPQDSNSYTKRLFNNSGIEKERFVHLEAAANNDFYYLALDDKIPMQFKDKFSFGLAFRHGASLGGGAGHVQIKQAWVRLYGDDGTYWNLHATNGAGSSDPASYWRQSNASFSINQTFVFFEGENSLITWTEWQSFTVMSAPLPVSGLIEIFLLNDEDASDQSKDFNSLSLEYFPYINGSYENKKGEAHIFTSTENNKAKIEEEVYIWDGIKKLFKGALLYHDGSDYVLADKFYHALEAGFGSAPLFKYITNQVWNQSRYETRMFLLTLQGLETTGALPELPGMVHKYLLSDVSYETLNRYFMCVAMQFQNYRECNWQGTFLEVYSIENGYEYDNNKWTHKYLSE